MSLTWVEKKNSNQKKFSANSFSLEVDCHSCTALPENNFKNSSLCFLNQEQPSIDADPLTKGSNAKQFKTRICFLSFLSAKRSKHDYADLFPVNKTTAVKSSTNFGGTLRRLYKQFLQLYF